MIVGGHIITIYDMENKEIQKELKGVPINATAVDIIDNCVISGHQNGLLALWDLSKSPELLPWSLRSGEFVNIFSAGEQAISQLAVNNIQLVSCSDYLMIWDLNKSSVLHREQLPVQIISNLILGHNSLIVGSTKIEYKDLRKKENNFFLDVPSRTTYMQSINDFYLYTTHETDSNLYIWDFRMLTMIKSLPGFPNTRKFQSDGIKIVSIGERNNLYYFDKNEISEIPIPPGSAIDFYFNEKELYIVSPQSISIYNFTPE